MSKLTENTIPIPKVDCRFCNAPLNNTFLDLGMSPLCQTQIKADELNHMEPFYPLHVFVCAKCFLVQLDEYVAPDEIFSSDYPYFSSFSPSWVDHARRYSGEMVERLGLNNESMVMEIASNDGYLLQHFVERGIRVLGIEPASNVAAAARAKGVQTEECFFGKQQAERISEHFGKPDLLLGNNVLAHVPDINGFVAGMKILLGPNGTITMEFPHLLNLIEKNQFDTIYHEHFSYLSLGVVQKLFASHGLDIFDVKKLHTHGGSLRIFAKHVDDKSRAIESSVRDTIDVEVAAGLQSLDMYSTFAKRVAETKWSIMDFLISEKRRGKTIVGYGAPGKGNTLLNYCGIRTDLIDYTVDRSPHKYGTYTPGTRIPILKPDAILETKPDYLFILPWNLKDEIIKQTSFIREWRGKWVVPIPTLHVIDGE
jgi:SAM-dependent methyltransferase